jgi:hypothetical protein
MRQLDRWNQVKISGLIAHDEALCLLNISSSKLIHIVQDTRTHKFQYSLQLDHMQYSCKIATNKRKKIAQR